MFSKVGYGEVKLFTACDTQILSQFVKRHAASSQASLKRLVMKC